MKAGSTIERIEQIDYTQAIQNSGDLEAATKAITATAEPATADYSVALTITAPTDARLVVTRICAQLNVTIDSFAGGTTLNYRIKRGGVSIGTGTLEAAGATGAKVVAHNVTAGILTGAATYEVFLWVNAGTCTVSVCQIYVGVGQSGYSTYNDCLRIDHVGQILIYIYASRQGSANFYVSVYTMPSTVFNALLFNRHYYVSSPLSSHLLSRQAIGEMKSPACAFVALQSVSSVTDLCCLVNVSVTLCKQA